MVWRGGDPQLVPLIPAVAGLTAVGTLLDEDEDAEEKRRRMEAKIAAENFGAAVGLAAGAAMALKGQSWKLRLMNTIDECMKYAADRDAFVSLMASEGYAVRWESGRKYITYITPPSLW